MCDIVESEYRKWNQNIIYVVVVAMVSIVQNHEPLLSHLSLKHENSNIVLSLGA
jgi:hypothetical protein